MWEKAGNPMGRQNPTSQFQYGGHIPTLNDSALSQYESFSDLITWWNMNGDLDFPFLKVYSS